MNTKHELQPEKPLQENALVFVGKILLTMFLFFIAAEVYSRYKESKQKNEPEKQEEQSPEIPPVWSILEMGDWEFDLLNPENTPIPEEYKKYSGKRVQILGYLRPLTTSLDNREFNLAEDFMHTCRGHLPQIHHQVYVVLNEGVSHQVSSTRTAVSGIFYPEVHKIGNQVSYVFRLEASSIRDIKIR